MAFVPVNEPLMAGNEKNYVNECIDSGWISSEGPFVEAFESKVAKRVGRKHAVAVSNGTAALDLAVESLGIGPGDEVILPSFTIISCVLQIVRSGAIPVVVDSNQETLNIDVAQVAKKINKKTKAIMVVHIYGLPVDLDPIRSLCDEHGLALIEDAAEMIGQTYKGRMCGSFGTVSTFSFYPNKHITTGEGGMLLTDDDELAATSRQLRNLCFENGQRFVHKRLGWNYRMSNLQAALGVAQLEQLDSFIEKKRKMGNFYNAAFKDLAHVQLPTPRTEYAENIYWVYTLILNEGLGTAEAMMKKLSKQYEIGTRPFFYPLHQQPALLDLGLFENVQAPVAERLYRQGLYIPSGLGLTENQMAKVASGVRDALGGLA